MILFFVITTIYAASLFFYRPSPASLKSKPLTLIDNFKCIKASLIIGIVLLVIFLITSNFNFVEIDKQLYTLLGLNNIEGYSKLWLLQIVTHLLIHANLIHILGNVIGIGIASVYERKVGSKRYISVFFVGGISSIPSILFYSEPVITCGISGGVFGLAAAYFTDYKNVSLKEWFYSIILFLFLAIIFSFNNEMKISSKDNIELHINHMTHILGAIGAIIYCRFFPRKL